MSSTVCQAPSRRTATIASTVRCDFVVPKVSSSFLSPEDASVSRHVPTVVNRRRRASQTPARRRGAPTLPHRLLGRGAPAPRVVRLTERPSFRRPRSHGKRRGGVSCGNAPCGRGDTEEARGGRAVPGRRVRRPAGSGGGGQGRGDVGRATPR